MMHRDRARYDQMSHVSPTVQAHSHALAAEEAQKAMNLERCYEELEFASKKYMEGANLTRDAQTILALKLLAESHANRATTIKKRFLLMTDDDTQERSLQSVPERNMETNKHSSHNKYAQFTANSSTTPDQHSTDRTGPGLGAEIPWEPSEEETKDKLFQAETELNDLWQRLTQLGIPRPSAMNRSQMLSSSRHLSSSLGESFLLLPGRGNMGAKPPTIDAGAALYAASLSRLQNQRARLMEKQSKTSESTIRSSHDAKGIESRNGDKFSNEAESRGPNSAEKFPRNSSDKGIGDNSLALVSHQKHEIMRLLQAVKTLSAENTALLKKYEEKARLEDEKKQFEDQVKEFKDQYSKKFGTLKRALEEWKRQQRDHLNSNTREFSTENSSTGRITEKQLELLVKELEAEKEANKKKDLMLKKYEQWYQQLRAGAKRKQQQQQRGSGNGDGGSSSTNGGDSSSGGRRPPPHPSSVSR